VTLLPLATKRDFNGKTTTYSYDTLNRLLKKTPDASLTRLRSPSRIHPQGSAPRWRTPAVRPLILCTDYRDRLKTKATSEGTLSYTYDAHGNVSTIVSSNPNGASLAYDYDALNRLVTVTDNRLIKQGAAAWETTYTYDPAGNLASYRDPNAVQTTLTYDPLNRLTQLSSVKGSTLASFGYTLGLAGNRTAVAEQGGRAVSYGYDNDYRLISETITGDPMTARNGTVSYGTVSQPGYDQVGNRTQMTSTVSALGTGTTSYSYDANDRWTVREPLVAG